MGLWVMVIVIHAENAVTSILICFGIDYITFLQHVLWSVRKSLKIVV